MDIARSALERKGGGLVRTGVMEYVGGGWMEVLERVWVRSDMRPWS